MLNRVYRDQIENQAKENEETTNNLNPENQEVERNGQENNINECNENTVDQLRPHSNY